MPKEYDVNDVHLYIKAVMGLPERQRMCLWYSIVYDQPSDCPRRLARRFEAQNPWVKANILYRFGPIIEKIVREEAQRYFAEARKQDDENG